MVGLWARLIVVTALLGMAGGISPAHALSMRVAGDQIILSGVVDLGDTDRLQGLLDEHAAAVTTVILRNSPGGSSFAGMRMGKMLRERGIRTVVSGYCISACTRIFLGGAERHFADDAPPTRSFIGFHGRYDSNTAIVLSDAWEQREWVKAYTDGKVDPALVEFWTMRTSAYEFVAFFDPNRTDSDTVFLCDWRQRATFPGSCKRLPDKDAYNSGITTSLTLIKMNQ